MKVSEKDCIDLSKTVIFDATVALFGVSGTLV